MINENDNANVLDDHIINILDMLKGCEWAECLHIQSAVLINLINAMVEDDRDIEFAGKLMDKIKEGVIKELSIVWGVRPH